jgi:hypothetical protein
MIDYEVNVFDAVYRKVSHLFAKGKFVSMYVPSPTGFPAGSLVELTNSTVQKRQSSTPIENYAVVMYQLDVYALTKQEARSLLSEVDNVMIGLGFSRVGGEFLDNMSNVNVFRYAARYEAEIDRDGNIYRIS